MKVEEFSLSDEGLAAADGHDILSIKIDGTQVFSVCEGEPEDNTLARNFSDCWDIVKLMRQAYEAGVNQEKFTVDSTLTDEL